MKKAGKIVLIVLLVLVIGLGAVAVWQRDTIKVLLMDPEKQAQATEDQSESLRAYMEDYMGIPLREFTDEEREKIREGTLSASEVMAKILAEQSPETLQKAGIPVSGSSAQGTDSGNQGEGQATTQNDIVYRYQGKFSALQSKFLGQVEGTIGAAKSAYISMVENGTPSEAAKAQVAASYTGTLLGLEGQCDGEFEALLGQMRSELQAIGGDTGICSVVRSTYEGEKAAKIAYYKSQYSR